MSDHALVPPQASDAILRRMLVPAAVVLSVCLSLAFARHLAIGADQPRLSRNLLLAIHVATVVPAVPLGAYLLARRKGDALHRGLGRLWLGLMFFTALASFGLRNPDGGFSPIHLLSILVVVTVVRGLLMAVRGDIAGHRRSMTYLYAGLIGAGAFVFLPERLFGHWLFG